MSKHLRLALLIISVLLVCCGLLALVYTSWPLEDVYLRSTLSPTLFAPP